LPCSHHTGWIKSRSNFRRAEAGARTALSLDDHDAARHKAMGYVCQHHRKSDLAEMHFNRVMSLNPNDVYIAVDRANWLVRVDKPAEALQGLEAAMQHDPSSPTWLWEIRYNTLFHWGALRRGHRRAPQPVDVALLTSRLHRGGPRACRPARCGVSGGRRISDGQVRRHDRTGRRRGTLRRVGAARAPARRAAQGRLLK
jgi:hypothetical protein